MTKVAVTEACVFAVAADPQQAYAFFSEPQNFREAMDGVLRCESIAENQVHWLLAEQAGQGVRFQPDYRVHYACDGIQHVRWQFLDGNMRNEGEIHIRRREDGGSDIDYRETVEPDLPITPLLMKLVQPLVIRELRRGLQHFIERSQVCLAKQSPTLSANRLATHH